MRVSASGWSKTSVPSTAFRKIVETKLENHYKHAGFMSFGVVQLGQAAIEHEGTQGRPPQVRGLGSGREGRQRAAATLHVEDADTVHLHHVRACLACGATG